jgi:hypothetical protein
MIIMRAFICSISNFLDEKIYLCNNSAYSQHQQLPPRDIQASPGRQYETIHDPPSRSVTRVPPLRGCETQTQTNASVVASHYEMAEPGHQAPVRMNTAVGENEATGAPYSHLVY